MIQLLKNIFGLSPKVDLKELVANGAKIVDVRTKAEYTQGHIKNSINIPLNNLSNHYASLSKIHQSSPVVHLV